MKLKRLTDKLKKFYYTSYIYSFYKSYILAIPFLKIFIDLDYLKEKIRDSLIFNLLYQLCKKVIIKFPKLNISISYLSIIFLMIIAIIFTDEEKFILMSVVTMYLLIYVLKNRDNVFFTSSVFSAILLFLMWQYGAKNVAGEGFSLWCCASVFYLTDKSLKSRKKICFLKCVHYINLATCLMAILLEKNVFYGKIVLYLLPFSLAYTVLVYKKAKRLLLFFSVIIASVLIGVKEGAAVLSCMALEVVLFCALYNPKYIFMAVLVTPAAFVSLINRFLIFRREFFLAGMTLDNIILVFYRYINNGLKGDVLAVRNTINQNTFKQLETISLGEQFFVYSILIFILITVVFLGRYIFRLIRRTLFLYNKNNHREKALVTGAISFFAGTSLMALLSSLSGSINTMVVYWILLGFIKSLHKNTGKP